MVGLYKIRVDYLARAESVRRPRWWQEWGISPFAILKARYLAIVRTTQCVLTNVCFWYKAMGFLHKIQGDSGEEKKKKRSLMPLSFLRCDPLSNCYFLKYHPSAHWFDEEIKEKGERRKKKKASDVIFYMLCLFYAQHESWAFPEIVSCPV